MRFFTMFVIMAMLLSSGCVGDNATRGQASGGFFETEPSIGRVAIGYGSVSFNHSDIVPGQEVIFHSSQYQIMYNSSGSNLLYTESMHVMPYVAGSVVISKEQKPLIQILGFRVDNPFSRSVSTMEFIPSSNTSTNVNK